MKVHSRRSLTIGNRPKFIGSLAWFFDTRGKGDRGKTAYKFALYLLHWIFRRKTCPLERKQEWVHVEALLFTNTQTKGCRLCMHGTCSMWRHELHDSFKELFYLLTRFCIHSIDSLFCRETIWVGGSLFRVTTWDVCTRSFWMTRFLLQ